MYLRKVDAVAAEFWASVVGALVGGLIAALTAVALFVAERRAAVKAREEQSVKESARSRADLEARRIEETESLLDGLEDTLLDLWVDDKEPRSTTPALRKLKSITRRAAAMLREGQPGAAEWISKLHFAAAMRAAAYLLIVSKPKNRRALADSFASVNFNGWVTTQHETFAGWRLGEISDREMLQFSSELQLTADKPRLDTGSSGSE